jgi:hypothetical protein
VAQHQERRRDAIGALFGKNKEEAAEIAKKALAK